MKSDKERNHLNDWITDRRSKPLDFGAFDCCTLCADYLQELHGLEDLMADLRGTYKSHAEAMRVLKKNGGLQGMVEKRLGKMQPPGFAQAGAIVMGDFGHGPALGICTGHNIAAVGESGLVFTSLSNAKGCWLL